MSQKYLVCLALFFEFLTSSLFSADSSSQLNSIRNVNVSSSSVNWRLKASYFTQCLVVRSVAGHLSLPVQNSVYSSFVFQLHNRFFWPDHPLTLFLERYAKNTQQLMNSRFWLQFMKGDFGNRTFCLNEEFSLVERVRKQDLIGRRDKQRNWYFHTSCISYNL